VSAKRPVFPWVCGPWIPRRLETGSKPQFPAISAPVSNADFPISGSSGGGHRRPVRILANWFQKANASALAPALADVVEQSVVLYAFGEAELPFLLEPR
jgi:hypothetical protein